MQTGYAGRQVVGIDLHRRRSVVVRMNAAGERLGMARINNDPFAFAEQIALMGEHPQVVLEATYGWYWAVDLLQEAGASVHLAHPLGVKGFTYRRVKNDERDASDLADLWRMGRLPQAWIAPPWVRALREIVRHRAKLVALRSGLKCQVHAVLAKCGVTVPMSDLFGIDGTGLLDRLDLPQVYQARVVSLRRLIEVYDEEIDRAGKLAAAGLVTNAGYRAIQQIPGIGATFAAIIIAEIGEISRFDRAEQLCSWAGLTPKHYESDTKVRRGRITKQGSRLLRWACVEAVARARHAPWSMAKDRLAARRGTRIAQVACARKLLTLIFYALRDGHLRLLDGQAPTAHARAAQGKETG